jgi:hypothetical protein
MPKVKTVVVTLIAALALSSAATGTAPAALWYVNGSHLNDPTDIFSQGTVDRVLLLNVPNARIKMTCSSTRLAWSLSELVPPNEILINSMEFPNCTVTEPTTCALEDQPLTWLSTPLMAVTAKGTAPADKLTLLPRTGTRFGELPFTLASCPFEGIQPINGQVTMNMPAGQDESTLQLFEALGTTENSSLTIGAGSRLYLENGKVLWELHSGSKWSFH